MLLPAATPTTEIYTLSLHDALPILTEEQRLLRDTARDVAQNLLAPYAAEWDREARFPKEALAELGKLGFMGMLVPTAYGGGGAVHVGFVLVFGEIGVRCVTHNVFINIHWLCYFSGCS